MGYGEFKKLDTDHLISAMETGDFYASTGVFLEKLYMDQDEIKIVIDSEVGVNYEIAFMGYQKGAEEVVTFKKNPRYFGIIYLSKRRCFCQGQYQFDAKKCIIENEKSMAQPLTSIGFFKF